MATPLLQPSFASGELAPALHGRVDLAKYHVGLKMCRNFTVRVEGGVTNRSGTEFIREVKSSALKPRLIPFQASPEQTFVIELGNLYARFITNGGYVLTTGSAIYEIVTPWGQADLALLKFTQSADVMTIVHPDYEARNLKHLAADDWEIETIVYGQTITAPTGVAAVVGGTPIPGDVDPPPANRDYSYKVTAVSATTGEESIASSAASVTNQALSVTRWNTVSWSAVTGADQYYVYKLSGGVYGLVGVSDTTSFRDDNIKADTSIAPPELNTPFADGNNPGVVGYYEQRRIFAASTSKPQTIWMSQVGNFGNFNKSQPLKADDEIERTLVGGAPGGRHQALQIRHLVPMNVLLIFTSGAEWKGDAGQNDAITPDTLVTRPQSYYGCSHVAPLICGQQLLFIQEKGGKILDLHYDFSTDSWKADDVTLLAKHLFRGKVVTAWGWSETPDNVVWTVQDDGSLLSFTYIPSQEMIAWSRHDSAGGVFEDVAVVAEGNEDAVYFLVRRTINGSTKRYVERLRSRYYDDITQAWFLDCARQYSGAPATIISGLGYLEGQTVGILADGNVLPQQVVTGGQVTLDRSASVVTVGLPIVAQMQTLPLDTGQPTTQGKKKRITAVGLRVEETRGLKAGPDVNTLREFKERTTEPWGTPVLSRTGDIRVPIDPTWQLEGSIVVQQDNPLPATILALVPEVEIGDR